MPRVRRASAIRRPASGAVTSSCSAVPPISLATAASASPAAGTSTATTVAPSRASTSAIAAPMPRAAPVTTATLPCQRSLPVRGRQRRRADADDLAVDVGRPAGEEEPQRGLGRAPRRRRRRARGWRWHRLAAPCRWSGRALERPLGGGLRRVVVRSRRIGRPRRPARCGRSRLRAGRRTSRAVGEVAGRVARWRRRRPRRAGRRRRPRRAASTPSARSSPRRATSRAGRRRSRPARHRAVEQRLVRARSGAAGRAAAARACG